MGADIHMMMEYVNYTDRDGKDMWWDFGADINPGRDYALFGIIAEVRGDGPAIVEPRGLPENMSWRAREYFEDDADLHTPTWLTVKELAACIAKRKKVEPEYGVSVGYDAMLATMRAFERRGSKTRVIIAFDN